MSFRLKSTLKSEEIPFNLPDNWTWYKWGDLISEYQQGLIRSNGELVESGVPYLKMNNLDNDGGYDLNKMEYAAVTDNELEKYKLRKGDFLLNVRNSKELVGKTCVIGNHNFDIVYNHMLVRIKHHQGISGSYINALLKVPVMRKFVDRCKSGTTTVIALYQRDLYEIPIPLPDKSTHDLIVAFVENNSSKIELNNRINAELEAMAKTIYDYWFVQFDFPDKNGKPHKSTGGKMVWNEDLKRAIPENWEVKFLSDWIEKDKSGDWGKENIEGNYTERVHCIRGADINNLNGKGEVKSPVRYILPKNSHKILEPFDLIIEISGGSPTQSTGRLALLIEETLSRFDAPVICSNFCKAVTLKYPKSIFNFVFEWNNAYNNGVLFGFEGKTSGIKNLLFESFVNSFRSPVPPVTLMDNFYDKVYSLELKKQKLLMENKELSALRDWLLPMLMNGQVSIVK
jgi:type I restriction enzyme S subunit